MFLEAKPIWAKGKTNELNTFVVFQGKLDGAVKAELHIAGTVFYRVYVNGQFLCAGPARTAKGYVREDVITLPESQAEREIVIEAVGYYCKSISTVKQPSGLMAEVHSEGTLLMSLAKDFHIYMPPCKVQKTERYSAQRHFTEIWDYTEKKGELLEKWLVEAEIIDEVPVVIDRVAPYPAYHKRSLCSASQKGSYKFKEELPYQKEKYSWKMSEDWGCFPYDEIEHHPFAWAQCLVTCKKSGEEMLPLTLNEGEYALFDFTQTEAGFLRSQLCALQKSEIVLSFCEYFEGENFEFQNMNAHNVVEYILDENESRQVQSFEPYTFRFVMLAVKKGSVLVESFGMTSYEFDTSRVQMLNSSNDVLNRIYKAAVRTFAHNAVDLYFDCPSRERAGWLCDSYFTAKTEYALTGKTSVEDAFLENYRLYKNQGELPSGVIPKCYPSDAMEHQAFVPQWTMWYILEVEEYIHVRGNEEKKELFRQSIYDLLAFYRQYENEDGLLERLPSWNFVEWSKANDWTEDVNYPTNFLYAKVLECVALLYGDEECRIRCAQVRKKTIESSFRDGYFRDHSVRDEHGNLVLCEDASEAGQYYAVLFGGIDLNSDTYCYLKSLILNVFSPQRTENVEEIFPVNMFIGAYLRLEVLLKMKEYALVLKDVVGFFGNMEAYTGTLWEYKTHKGSYDHGFASYAAVVIGKALEETYKPLPFWSWNDKLETKGLTEQIQWMKENGFGGFFMHARSGLDTEYLGEEWFDCIRECCKKAEKSGMQAWAYDENGWPSGFADGKLLEDEQNRDRYLAYTIGTYDEKALVSYEFCENKLKRVLGSPKKQGKFLNVYEHIAVSTADVLNKEVVDQFIKLTHQRYKKELGEDFSSAIAGFFTDEPQYQRWAHPYTKVLPAYFKEKYGEDLLDSLGLMFVEAEGYRAFRYKYWICMQELMLHAFGENIYQWCDTHGVRLTGHYYEEATLAGQMRGCAGVMPFYEFEHIPGIDKLGKQLASPAAAKQVSSVARQLGKKQVLTESYAGCGWNVTPRELKRITEHQYVHGVNLLCHHLLPYSETGQRKRDFPAHFSDITPWVRKDIKTFNDYFTKLGYLLGESEEIVSVAVFCPIRSVYLEYKHSDSACISEIEKSYADLLTSLSKWNIPYHILDETILEKYGACDNAGLSVGQCIYDTIVFPKTDTMSKQTWRLLQAFLNQGGKVLFTDGVPAFLEGEEYEFGLQSNVTWKEMQCAQKYQIDLTDTEVYSTLHEDRQGNYFLYAVNVSDREAYEVTFDGDFQSFKGYELETESYYKQSKKVYFRPGQSKVLYFSMEKAPAEVKKEEIVLKGEMKITDVSDNYLTLDRVSISYDGTNYSEEYSCAKVFNDLLEQRYDGELWLKYCFNVKTVPERLSFLAENMNRISCTMNGIPLEFDGAADFEKRIDKADISSFCKVGCNEVVMKIHFFERESTYYALFGEGVTESLRNCIVYDTCIEACYLQGDFGVYSDCAFERDSKTGIYFCDGAFYLDKKPQTVTDTVTQGYPFFAGNMTVQIHFESDGSPCELRMPKNVHLSYLKVNGTPVQKGYFEDLADISDYVHTGVNVAEITVYSGNRNLFGPHHYLPEPEPKLAMPNRFDFILYYKNGKCEREASGYSFVGFCETKEDINR